MGQIRGQEFWIEAVSPSYLDGIRRAGVDEAGNIWKAWVTKDPRGVPLRCCLRMSRPGDSIAVIAYAPPGTAGAYREVGPVFVHGGPCKGYEEPHAWPSEFRARRQILRGYNAKGRIHDAHMIEADEAEAGIARMFADPEVVIVHSRNVEWGCFMFAIHHV
jgi:Protein of unknown function (DUF1203)